MEVSTQVNEVSEVAKNAHLQTSSYALKFSQINIHDIPSVGGKNASLGEMIHHLSQYNVRVPNGFATTAQAFFDFLDYNDIRNKINSELDALDVSNVQQLAKVGQTIRTIVKNAELQPELVNAITEHYKNLELEKGFLNVPVAIRSSATAEDLPEASFAGQQESYLNISGITNVLKYVQKVYASLYTDRAIAYRVHNGFAHSSVALSVGVQFMVSSNNASSGVMFSIDTESGFNDVVFITSAYGLGEMVVQGSVNPDEFYVSKSNLCKNKPAILRKRLGSKLQKMVYSSQPTKEFVEVVDTDVKERRLFSLNDKEIEELAKFALAIEKHYQRPMDIEWGKDSNDGKLYILQARPETVSAKTNQNIIHHYEINESKKTVLAKGRAIGQKIGTGIAKIINTPEDIHLVNAGDVLVTDITDPDWEPIMKRASAIVTNRGGRTCHAAIIAREMGIPAVVGCGHATSSIAAGEYVTVSCAEGDTGFVYQGNIPFTVKDINLTDMPELPIKIMMNLANPNLAFANSMLPNDGVGLARIEFIINNMIGIHPRALLDFDKLDASYQERILEKTSAYSSPTDFYVRKLAEGLAVLACAFKNKTVIVRFSDFKTNEYKNLLGGELYEPHEENPMIGFRGASRYVAPQFADCFALECQAVKYVREVMGFCNLQVMVPFVRTVSEGVAVINELKKNGLERGKNNLKVIMMCELPSNAVLAEEFLEHFDGFSIGSNDLTQLTLGLDRDSEIIAHQFDERNLAVKKLMEHAIKVCKQKNKYVGICGQGPSDYPDLAQWLIDCGIESLSLNPDSVLQTWLYLAKQ